MSVFKKINILSTDDQENDAFLDFVFKKNESDDCKTRLFGGLWCGECSAGCRVKFFIRPLMEQLKEKDSTYQQRKTLFFTTCIRHTDIFLELFNKYFEEWL